jgi:hypothetical protein
LDSVFAGKSYHDVIDVCANWHRLNHFRFSGASIRRKRSAISRFVEMPVSAVCWFFTIWLCSLVPLKAAVAIFVVPKFDDDLPSGFFNFSNRAQPLSFSLKMTLSPNRTARAADGRQRR